MPNNGFAALLEDWEGLLSAMDDGPCEMSDLDVLVDQLETTLADLKTAHTRRTVFREKAMQLTQEIYAKTGEGKDLATRIRSWAVARYGHRSEKLTEFGRKPTRRRKGEEAPLNPTAP